MVEKSSDMDRLDKAAVNAVNASNRLPALPADFHGPYVGLRMIFFYNLPVDHSGSR
jgi:hypothetical protein